MEGERFCYKSGLFNGGEMVMLERWTYVYFYCILWSIGIVFLFLVYSISYLLNLLNFLFTNVFPPHCRIFAHRGAGGLYACKNRASMSKQKGE